MPSSDDASQETLTKAKIVDAIYGRLECTKKEVSEYVDTVIATIKETAEVGDEIKISGFGKFIVRHKEAQPGRNPQTMEEYEIPERKVLRFKMSPVFKEELNGEREFDGF
jgi:integration host factor subunit alpha